MPKRILVVDDDWLVCENLKLCLEIEGYVVTIAHDCRTARAKARQRKPDLAILDVVLPDGDGIELGQWLRRELGVPFVLVTAHLEEAAVASAVELGAEDTIAKPFNISDLLECIRSAIGKSGRKLPPE